MNRDMILKMAETEAMAIHRLIPVVPVKTIRLQPGAEIKFNSVLALLDSRIAEASIKDLCCYLYESYYQRFISPEAFRALLPKVIYEWLLEAYGCTRETLSALYHGVLFVLPESGIASPSIMRVLDEVFVRAILRSIDLSFEDKAGLLLKCWWTYLATYGALFDGVSALYYLFYSDLTPARAWAYLQLVGGHLGVPFQGLTAGSNFDSRPQLYEPILPGWFDRIWRAENISFIREFVTSDRIAQDIALSLSVLKENIPSQLFHPISSAFSDVSVNQIESERLEWLGCISAAKGKPAS